jgi:hypothetical protein
MNFSLKTSLGIFTLIGLWLGAILSANTILLEGMIGLSALIVFVALPLSIWDTNQQRRPFWAGFFAVGFGNMILIANSVNYSAVSQGVAASVGAGPTVAVGQMWSPVAPPVQTSPSLTLSPQAIPSAQPLAPIYASYATPYVNSSSVYDSIQVAVPSAITLMMALVGGIITARFAATSSGTSDIDRQ